MQELAKMHSEGIAKFRANCLAERLWPNGRRQNAKGQRFHLGAAVAARLLRNCPAVWEKEPRLWEILPHKLPHVALPLPEVPELPEQGNPEP